MLKKILLVILVLGIAGTTFYVSRLTKSDFPLEIKRRVNFPLYYPKGNIEPFALDATTIKFYQDPKESERPGVSFRLVSPGNTVTLTEQQTPDLVTEQVGLDKLASTMNAYKEIITSVGRVELTRPTELKGAQTAVAVPGFTTLIFARPEKDLDENQWRKIFNALELVR